MPLAAFQQGCLALPCVCRVPGVAGMNGLTSSWRPRASSVWTFFPFMLDLPLLGWLLTACSPWCSRVILHPPLPPESSVQRWSACSFSTKWSMSPSWGPTGVLLETLRTAPVSGGTGETLPEYWLGTEWGSIIIHKKCFPFHRVADSHLRATVLYGDVLRIASDSLTMMSHGPCTGQVRALRTKGPLAELLRTAAEGLVR